MDETYETAALFAAITALLWLGLIARGMHDRRMQQLSRCACGGTKGPWDKECGTCRVN